MNAKIKDLDKGYAALKERVERMLRVGVSVGVHDAEGSQEAEGSDGATLSEVAAFNEFGTENIPRRSFLADWADENAEQHKVLISKIARAVVQGKLPSLEAGLNRMGLQFVGEIQQRIAAGIAPENAPSTIARKGSSTPLIDTGQLRSAITYQINHDAFNNSE